MRGAVVRTALAAALMALAASGQAQPGLDFMPCADAASHPLLAGTDCAEHRVPLQASAASGASPTLAGLFVRRFPAARPRGRIWLIAGGPGESGATLYPQVATVRRAFPDLDVLVPDHRGTGRSERLCPAEESPASPGGTALVGEEWGRCITALQQQPTRVAQFSLTQAARDLHSLLRTTPTQGQQFLYAVSYGTQLVLRSLALAPMRLDGLILDSLVPLPTDAQHHLSKRSATTNEIGLALLQACSRSARCRERLGPSPQIAVQAVLAQVGQTPLQGLRRPISDLRPWLGLMLDEPGLRARLPELIADLRSGGTAVWREVEHELERLQAQWSSLPDAEPSIPLVSIISISENHLRPTLNRKAIESEESELLFTSPIAGLMASSPFPRYSLAPDEGRMPLRLPRTLVIQGGLDPKTPLAAAQRHVAALRHLGDLQMQPAVWAPHFVLRYAPTCWLEAVRHFRSGLVLPLRGGACAQESAPSF